MHFLNMEGFFGDAFTERILNPVTLLTEEDKAGELVKMIRLRVSQDPSSFHILLHRLKLSGKLYMPIVQKLEEEFQKQMPLAPRDSPSKLFF